MRLNEYVNKQRKNLEAESQKCETARNVLATATGNPDLSAAQASQYRMAVDTAVKHVIDDDARIAISVLFPDWAAGSHAVGDIYNADAQTWECYQAYDNAVYPDIRPGQTAWYAFNRPLHGKSAETARSWTAPTGAHDIYKSGEYMIYTDGKLYRCKSDTNFSPIDYAAAWIKV